MKKRFLLIALLFLISCGEFKSYLIKIDDRKYFKEDLKKIYFTNLTELVEKTIILHYEKQKIDKSLIDMKVSVKYEEMLIRDIFQENIYDDDKVDELLRFRLNENKDYLSKYHIKIYRKNAKKDEPLYDSGGLQFFEVYPDSIKDFIKFNLSGKNTRMEIFNETVVSIADYKKYYLTKLENDFIDELKEKYFQDINFDLENVRMFYEMFYYDKPYDKDLNLMKNGNAKTIDFFTSSPFFHSLISYSNFDDFSNNLEIIYFFENLKQAFQKQIDQEKVTKQKEYLRNDLIIDEAIKNYIFSSEKYLLELKKYYFKNKDVYKRYFRLSKKTENDTLSLREKVEKSDLRDKNLILKNIDSVVKNNSNNYEYYYYINFDNAKYSIVEKFIKDLEPKLLSQLADSYRKKSKLIKIKDKKIKLIFGQAVKK